MAYPAALSAGASVFARLPAPTIATAGFRATRAAYHSHNFESARVSYSFQMAKPRKPNAPKARLLSSRTAYRGPVFSVTTDHVLEPGGIRARRDVVRHSGSIVVLAVDDRRSGPHILLEHQYRHAAKAMMWELPAGRIDDGEQELAAAKRELLEETGYTAKYWKRILHFYVSPGFLDETMSIYLAKGLCAGIAQPEEDERIETHFFPVSKAVGMVRRGLIQDAKTIAGILWFAQGRGR